jgi:hypothetical protein
VLRSIGPREISPVPPLLTRKTQGVKVGLLLPYESCCSCVRLFIGMAGRYVPWGVDRGGWTLLSDITVAQDGGQPLRLYIVQDVNLWFFSGFGETRGMVLQILVGCLDRCCAERLPVRLVSDRMSNLLFFASHEAFAAVRRKRFYQAHSARQDSPCALCRTGVSNILFFAPYEAFVAVRRKRFYQAHSAWQDFPCALCRTGVSNVLFFALHEEVAAAGCQPFHRDSTSPEYSVRTSPPSVSSSSAPSSLKPRCSPSM